MMFVAPAFEGFARLPRLPPDTEDDPDLSTETVELSGVPVAEQFNRGNMPARHEWVGERDCAQDTGLGVTG